jgi:hypothetical protein
VDTRTLLYGEGHPVVRDPFDIARIAFVAGFLVLLLSGESGAVNVGVAA